MKRIKYLLVFSILTGTILLLMRLLGNYYVSAEENNARPHLIRTVTPELMQPVKDDAWQYGALVASPSLMQQVKNENFPPDAPVAPGRMQVLKLQHPGQIAPLFFISSRLQYECPPTGCSSYAEPLCGTAGCAYFGYLQEGNFSRRIFSEYLKDLLPPGVPFLRVSNQLSSGLPCLEFAELTNVASADSLQISRFCYNGKEYALVSRKKLAVSQE